ncbi:MAG: hypothetical protein AAGD10_20310 [Myxococcota bacterium]
MLRISAILILLLAAPGPASAANVAIGSVSGPTGAQIGYGIERALQGKAEVVSNLKYEAEARNAEAAPNDVSAVARVGRALDVDAVVIGEVLRDGRQWRAKIQLVDAHLGQVATEWNFDSPQLRSLADMARRQAWVKLAAALREAESHRGSAPAAAAAPPAAPPAAPSTAPPPAASASDQVKVVLMDFETGRRGAALRNYVGAGMNGNARIKFLNYEQVQAEAAKIGVSLEDPVGRLATAELLKVNAFIRGTVFKRGDFNYGTMEIFEGQSGEPLETLKLRRQYVRSLGAALAERALPIVLGARAPEPPPPAPAPDAMATVGDSRDGGSAEASARTRAPKKPRPPRDASARSNSPLRITMGFNSQFRSFGFNDIRENRGELARPYSSSFSPAVGLGLDWFPVAHFTREGALPHIGIGLDADYAFGLVSTSQEANGDQLEFPTNSFSFVGSLIGRLPLGASELGAEIGFGTDRFALDPTEVDGRDAPTPDVEYEFLRLGVSGRWRVVPQLDLAGGVAYRAIVGTGEFGSATWFPDASVNGLDAELSIGTPILDPVHLEAGANYQHYFASLNQRESDSVVTAGTVAGGTLDQYVNAFLRLAIVL